MHALFSNRHSRSVARSLGSFVAFSIMVLAATADAQAQSTRLNQNCVVGILNRTTQVRADGTWVVPNVPANFGQVRARATCVEGGRTTSGQSNPFVIPPRGGIDVPPIVIGETTPIPSAITITTAPGFLAAPGSTLQLNVVASYGTGPTRNITNASTGTQYTVSNPAIATISPNGLLTAVSSGNVVVQATHEGASGLISVPVNLGGNDADGDGIPDDAELRLGLNPNNPGDALEDPDSDGLNNVGEFRAGTEIRNPDTDGDGILDGEEVVPGVDGFLTNPLSVDTDNDGVRDRTEILTGSDPTNAASRNLDRAVTRLEVAPANFSLLVNTVFGEAFTQLQVTGRLIDNFTIDLTSAARGTNYTSSDLAICNFGGVAGRVFAGQPGNCTITIANGSFRATATGLVRQFAPTALSSLVVPGFANAVDVQGNVAYVAAGAAGLQLVNVTSRTTPILGAVRDTPGNANDVRVAGTFAYVADGSSGLQIYNISDPAAPILAGSFDTPGVAQGVALLGTSAFIADGTSGLQIVNVSNPGAAILAGSLALSGTAKGVAVDPLRNLAVVAAGASGIHIVDIANVSAPIRLSTIAVPGGDARDVEISGNTVFVAANTGSLVSFDITNPATPLQRGTTPSATGGQLTDVKVTRGLALGADAQFGNRLTVIAVGAPEAMIPRAVLAFPNENNFRGTGIAADATFAYMTATSGGGENGTTGTSRLFIGQYLSLEDNAGVPPQVSLAAPAAGQTQFEGATLTLRADASDDVAVGSVRFLVNGETVFTDTSEPYEYSFTVPVVNSLTLGVSATDLGGNVATGANVVVPVAPDPLTTVSGIVVDGSGVPIVGATVTANGNRTAVTGAAGAFSITGVPTVQGRIIVSATAVVAAQSLSGSSAAFDAVRGGITNVGSFAAVAVGWETNFGEFWTSADDTSTLRTLPFPFPFYGTNRTSVHVGTNGYITFGSGDSTYVETVQAFSSLPRISAFFDDLFGRSTGRTLINATLPGRFVVTYDRVQHFSAGGSNTLQIVLYQDGRIQFGFQGITARSTGTITGITPGPNSPFQQVNFSEARNFDLPAGTAAFEYFTAQNLFDLANGFILFTPRPGGGYNVRTILQPPTSPVITLSGPSAAPVVASSASRSGKPVAKQAALATSPLYFANAEIEVTSTGDSTFLASVNTDAAGRWSVRNVPPGTVKVDAWRRGVLVGTASVTIPFTEALSNVELALEPVVEAAGKQAPQP